MWEGARQDQVGQQGACARAPPSGSLGDQPGTLPWEERLLLGFP